MDQNGLLGHKINMDNFMLRIIESDFKVSTLCKNEEACLYYGFKDELVHLVLYTKSAVDQTHVLRFQFAACFEYLLDKDEASPRVFEISEKLAVEKLSDTAFIFHYGQRQFEIDTKVNADFFAVIHADIKVYKEAYTRIDLAKLQKLSSELTTDSGKPIILTYDNLRLLFVYQFENLLFGNDKRKTHLSFNALYSNTLDKKYAVSAAEFQKMAEQLSYFTPESLEVIEMPLMDLQHELFGEIIWGKDVDRSGTSTAIGGILKEGFSKLTPSQKVMFKSIYKQHAGFVLLVFAFVTGKISLQQYIHFATGGYQPDSKEEQKIRSQATMIDYYRKLTEPRDYRYLTYRVQLPQDKDLHAKTYHYFDHHFLSARDKAIRQVKAYKAKHKKYADVKLQLYFMEYNDPDPAEYRTIDILTGNRMHSDEILGALDTEAKILQNNCGENFPVMQTASPEVEGVSDAKEYIAVNQSFVSLYYFTAS